MNNSLNKIDKIIFFINSSGTILFSSVFIQSTNGGKRVKLIIVTIFIKNETHRNYFVP